MDEQTQFFYTLYPYIREALIQEGIDPAWAPIVTSQNMLETTWGTNANAKINNFFGMKASPEQEGEYFYTNEGYGNNQTRIKDKFLPFPSMEEGARKGVIRLRDKFHAFEGEPSAEQYVRNISSVPGQAYFTDSFEGYLSKVNGILNGKRAKAALEQYKKDEQQREEAEFNRYIDSRLAARTDALRPSTFYQTQVENTRIAPVMVPDSNSYVQAHRLTESEDRTEGLRKAFDARNAYERAMEATSLQNTAAPAFQPTGTPFAEGGFLQPKDAWDKLSLAEKAEMMKIAVRNGISNLSDIRQKYNEFAEGGDTEEEQEPIVPFEQKVEVVITPDSEYNQYLNTLPDNQRFTPNDRYDSYLYWKLNGKPRNFEEAYRRGMFHYDRSDNGYHANSISFGPDGIGYFMKPKDHDTVGYELDWFNKGLVTEEGGWQRPETFLEWKESQPFRDSYILVGDPNRPNYYRYQPVNRHSIGGPIIEAANTFDDGGYVYDVLPKLLKEAGLNIRVTSGYRKPGAVGTAGNKSWHGRHGAVEIVPQGNTTFEDIENAIYNNPTISNYMLSNGFGLIDESGRSAESKATMKKTGATGAHFHIGKDSKYAKRYADRMAELSRATQPVVELPVSTAVYNPYLLQQEAVAPVQQEVGVVEPAQVAEPTPEQLKAAQFKERIDRWNQFQNVMRIAGIKTGFEDLGLPVFMPGSELTMLDGIWNNEYKKGGKIHIKPSKRGTFTAAASKHGKSVQAFASQVLAHPENYSPAMRKKANFARNASHWKHGLGGNLFDGTTQPSQQMNIGLNTTNGWKPYTFGEIVANGERVARQREALEEAMRNFQIESNDATSVAGGRPQNTHLEGKAVRGGAANAAWEKEHPNLTAWGNVLGAVPFAVAAAPVGAWGLAGISALGDAAAATSVGQGITNFLAPIATTSYAGATVPQWFDLGLTSGFGAHGLQTAIDEKGISPMTALEVAPLGRLAKPIWNTGKGEIRSLVSRPQTVNTIPQITAENAATITPEQWDAVYLKALDAGDKIEAQRLRDLHFITKAPDTKITTSDRKPVHIYHGTDADWTSYDASKFGSATDDGYYGVGLYGTEYKPLAKGYGDNVMDLYINSKSPYTAGTQDILGNPYTLEEAVDRASAIRFFNRDRSGVHFSGVNDNFPKILDELDSADAAVYGTPGQRFNEIVIPRGEQMKFADAITYDNDGNIIPISQRDNFKLNDLRYGLIPTLIGISSLGFAPKKKEK